MSSFPYEFKIAETEAYYGVRYRWDTSDGGVYVLILNGDEDSRTNREMLALVSMSKDEWIAFFAYALMSPATSDCSGILKSFEAEVLNSQPSYKGE